MSFLPIVQRELRVSSRRKSTYYARCAAAAVGMVMGFFLLLMSMLNGAGRMGGGFAFAALSWYALLTTLLAGVFLASDSLSEERREGTLGLLFLTDLKGYDVVLGKFMAVSLSAFYGLLAVFPVLAISLMAGGVSGLEFWRTCLALLNFLFFSVTTGILVSSFCKSSYRAMAASIAFLVIWLTAMRIISVTRLYCVSYVSPFEPFLMASDAEYFRRASAFWSSLAISHLAGWMFLGWSALRLKLFAETGQSTGRGPSIFTRDLLAGTAVRRARLLEINPVLWLLDDSRRMRWVAWLLSLSGVLVIMFITANSGGMSALIIGYATWPFYFLLKIFVAIQACRFFSEARRTGALELICCTPLTRRSVVQGQWMLLRRVFLWPLLVLLSTHLAILLYCSFSGNKLNGFPLAMPEGLFFLYYQFKFIVNNLADFFAIGWFGMWLALSMQRSNLAAGVTILSVLVLPMVAFCVPTVATDAIFISVGWAKLAEDFRLQAEWGKLKPSPRP